MENSERKFTLEGANTSNWNSWVKKPLVSAIYSLKEIAAMRGLINQDEGQALQMIMDWECLPGWMPEDGKWLEWNDDSYRESPKIKESKFDKRLREALEKGKEARNTNAPIITANQIKRDDQIDMKKSFMEVLGDNERMNFIDRVAEGLFISGRYLALDCYRRAEEFWEARQEFFKEKEEPKPHQEIATREWIEDYNSKTGWIDSGWKFEDGNSPLEEYWNEEIIDWDKYGNPIKAIFTRKE